MTKYKPGTRIQKSNATMILVIAGAAIAAAIAGGVYASMAGVLKPSPDNQPMAMHIHPTLSLIVDGKPVTIPANIGIDPNLYKDHTYDEYAMKMPDMASMPVMATTHTHDASGKIHTESSVKRDYTIGDFLSVWGMDFSGKTVKMTVDGKPVTEDFKGHVLKDGEQVVLEVQ